MTIPNAPAHIAHAMNIEDLFALANGLTAIETPDQESHADQLLDDIRKARKAADESRKLENKPFDDGKAIVQGNYNPILKRADIATDAVKGLLTPYRAALQAARDAEAKRLRDEAEALKAKATQSIQSEDIYDRIDGETMLKAIKDSEARANKIDRAPKGLRTHWEAEITDRRAALNALVKMHPDRFEALIEQLAGEAARGARQPIPGVLYHERKTAI